MQTSPSPKIIGIAGTNGSGKDTVGHLLAEKHGFLFVSGSDMLREEVKRRGLSIGRENTSMVSAEWRRESGLGVIIDKAVEIYQQQAAQHPGGLVIASLRNPGEADRVHELGGQVVWVDADPEIRHQRVSSIDRGRAANDNKTFEEFMADEHAEMYSSGDEATLNMSGVKEKADIFIENNGNDLEVFRADVEKALKAYL
jgi:dephospho-CoA kinase